LCAELHNRMPVVLEPEAWPEWLGEEPADETRLKSLLARARASATSKNNDPWLIKPVAVA
jgi:putative SOS response-associated peptidase YedK